MFLLPGLIWESQPFHNVRQLDPICSAVLYFLWRAACSESKYVYLQDKVYQFCSKVCCEDYKKLHCIVTFCEYCQEERTLHETVKFSGVKRPFCSEGSNLSQRRDGSCVAWL